jgi:hypothetical protein
MPDRSPIKTQPWPLVPPPYGIFPNDSALILKEDGTANDGIGGAMIIRGLLAASDKDLFWSMMAEQAPHRLGSLINLLRQITIAETEEVHTGPFEAQGLTGRQSLSLPDGDHLLGRHVLDVGLTSAGDENDMYRRPLFGLFDDRATTAQCLIVWMGSEDHG